MSIQVMGEVFPYDLNEEKAIMAGQMKIADILKVSQIDTEINRDVNYSRLPTIVKYLASFDSDLGIYLPALVLSYRSKSKNYPLSEIENATVLTITENDVLSVIDGQHRIKAIEKYMSEYGSTIAENYMTVQIYFGLTKEEEEMLFVSINSNSTRVSSSLISKYDSRDIMNILIRELYETSQALRNIGVDFEKSRLYTSSTKLFTSSRLVTFLSYLLFGKKTLTKIEENNVANNYESILSTLIKFFEIYEDVLPEDAYDSKKYVFTIEQVQNAIAFYLNEVITEFGSPYPWIDNWEESVQGISEFNWHVRNSPFKQLFLERKIGGSKDRYYGISITDFKNVIHIIEEKMLTN
ncbi:DNA sulfur modification protein DndB [Listeria booriae]|uniref:DNA sulfur modification protein DndB n=1 Tax=Listeria booriae TaxID=1552123 RepID=UPI001627F97C|nr:DNA sulfur modification protein DndB [Listeria booriae]MBC2037673.1 DGQHR domain-containing protein [Listeria booriae]